MSQAQSQALTGRPISLLLICHSYPPVLGGSELEAQRVCAALIRRGYRVTVVCAGGPPMPPQRDWVDPEGVPVRIYAGRWKGAAKDIVFALRVVGMLLWERRNYQLVYFLMQGLHLAAGLPVAKALGKPILMKIGGSGVIPLMTRSRSGRIELRWLRQWAQRVMILNQGMHQEAIQEGFPAKQLYWMPNPVDTDEFAPCVPEERPKRRTQFGIPLMARVVLYCGRLAPEKALPSLIQAFALAVRRIPEAMLVLVGDGPLQESLTAQAGELQIPPDCIRFAGRVSPSEVCSWLQIADVFALVSFSEGFPCALVEAMSAGLACVVSDIPANSQLIESGRHGVLAPAGDSEAIGAGLISLLEAPELRARMGVAARRRVLENYSTAKVADRYEALLREVLAAK
jgi:glycosyltransferase involved in cell wall biosynthesis